RLAIHKLRRTGQSVPFQTGNIFRRVDEDLSAGRLRHEEVDWRQTFRLAEELSNAHTELLGSAAVDLWHVAVAILLRADTFWTFERISTPSRRQRVNSGASHSFDRAGDGASAKKK